MGVENRAFYEYELIKTRRDGKISLSLILNISLKEPLKSEHDVPQGRISRPLCEQARSGCWLYHVDLALTL